MPCKHCKRDIKLKNKGLCTRCWHLHKDEYPSLPIRKKKDRSMVPQCIHCGQRQQQCRRLCYRCHDDVAIRRQYPPVRLGCDYRSRPGYVSGPVGKPIPVAHRARLAIIEVYIFRAEHHQEVTTPADKFEEGIPAQEWLAGCLIERD